MSGHFRRAIIMPNLVPPVTTSKLAAEYKQRILEVGNFQIHRTMLDL